MDFDSAFDVIIAGAGPAGCVLASRLSEDRDRRILLIEAGPDAIPGEEHPDVLHPFALPACYNEAFHWPNLVAETEPASCDDSVRKSRAYIQARCVGGASNINGMGADRGLPGDYERWRQLGADGWGWESVLPYFRKLECELDFPGDFSMHGDRGPMPVRRLPRSRWAPFPAAIGDALERRGVPFIGDYNADFRDGFSAVPTNCLLDRRMSASMAYLTREARQRPNLTILANARVDRLNLDGRRAGGVFICTRDATKLIRGRQVILCCGALQTPALLMRSGIGPRQHLAEHGIEVVQDLPGVGANLQNHPCLSLTAYLPRTAAQPLDNPWFLQNWLRFSSQHPECEPSDMHLMAFNKADWHDLGRRVGMITISVLDAYSKGSVELAGVAPDAMPNVRFNLFADRRDEDRMVSGVRFALELLTDWEVSAMRHELFLPKNSLVASLSRRTTWNSLRARTITWMLDIEPFRRMLLAPWAVDPKRLLADEGVLRTFVRRHVYVQFHVCGTCRMGSAGDVQAVVDGVGRVHGMEALRVADASIFPTVPRGYTHFIVLMAAEKMADAIKADWRASCSGRSSEPTSPSVTSPISAKS